MSSAFDDALPATLARVHERGRLLLAGAADEWTAAEEDREAGATAAATAPGYGASGARLQRLVDRFGLAPLSAKVIACLLATEYDPFLRTVVRAVQRELGRPWIEIGTIAELLGLPAPRVPELAALLAPGAPLLQSALVLVDPSVDAPAVSTRVRLPPRVARFLVGDDQLPAPLLRPAPRAVLSRSLVDQAVARALSARLVRALAAREPLVIELSGPRGVGRRFLAEGLAQAVGRPLLLCDLAQVEPAQLAATLGEARREARLDEALLCLVDWDTRHGRPGGAGPPIDEGEGAAPAASAKAAALPAALAELIDGLAGPLLLTDEERDPLLERSATVVQLTLPFPSPSQRARLLAEALDRRGAHIDPGVDLVALARRFALDPARIDRAARAAVEEVADELAATRPAAATGVPAAPRLLGHAELTEACRRQLRHDLRSLAARVTASHRWEDLVIPVDVYHGLREMIAYVRHGHTVYEDWGFSARHSLSQGVSALFAGPPGTGKTMCASVMARELDMELFRVDLSRIVSKWIGETEKNLARVFDEAQRSNAIILFDEADSLFARRTDVKSSVDRYANLEVNFLLQRMEAFSGVTLLTTNFEDTIDSAFKRRLTFRLRFEKPDAEARAALWRKVFPAGCALAADVDFERVAALFEMSGGNIRNAAVRAAFLAAAEERPVTMATLLLAAERESREMGLLTRSGTPPSALASDEAAGTAPAPPGRLRPLRGPRPSE